MTVAFCIKINPAGDRCPLAALPGSNYCKRHRPDSTARHHFAYKKAAKKKMAKFTAKKKKR